MGSELHHESEASASGATLDTDDDDLGLIVIQEDVREVQIMPSLAEKHVMDRLRYLSELPTGWDGANSVPPAPDVVARIRALVPAVVSLGIDVAVVAHAGGGIVLEWRRGANEFTAAVEPHDVMWLNVDSTETDQGDSFEGPYDQRRLIEFLRTGSLGAPRAS